MLCPEYIYDFNHKGRRAQLYNEWITVWALSSIVLLPLLCCCVYVLAVTVSCTSVTQGEPTVIVMHRGSGSRCPLSTALGLTTPNAPHTWPPTRGVKRRCVYMSRCVQTVYDLVVGNAMLFFLRSCLRWSYALFQKVFERLHLMYTVGYSISLASLLVAVSILSYFK